MLVHQESPGIDPLSCVCIIKLTDMLYPSISYYIYVGIVYPQQWNCLTYIASSFRSETPRLST